MSIGVIAGTGGSATGIETAPETTKNPINVKMFRPDLRNTSEIPFKIHQSQASGSITCKANSRWRGEA